MWLAIFIEQKVAKLNLLDVITNTCLIPVERLTLVELEYEHIQFLPAGQIGTIVSIYKENSPDPRYLIEFADSQGKEYAMATLKAEEVLALQFELTVAD